MTEMSKFERHINRPQEVEINGDTFEFKPLPIDHIQDIINAQSLFRGVHENMNEEEVTEKVSENTTDETINSAKRVVLNTLVNSYPNESEDTLAQFATSNFWAVLIAALQVNQNQSSDNTRNAAAEQAKKLQEEGDDVTAEE